jgi:hypothetical protein
LHAGGRRFESARLHHTFSLVRAAFLFPGGKMVKGHSALDRRARDALRLSAGASTSLMYFVLHPHGLNMIGRWVGLSYDGDIVTGWAAMARDEQEAADLIGQLKQQAAQLPV